MSLSGLRVIEFAGLAPAPFAGLVLADNGADVIRIDKCSSVSNDVLCRGKRSLAVNLKTASGRNVAKNLIASADVLIDPFRPGVMEKLGLGPEVFVAREGLNNRLIYARIVGFSRSGPHKDMAGHDINYLALSGILSILPGTPEKPEFPLNILADFAGGGLTCALGILLALIERSKSGLGQVVDTDMVSGVRYLSSFPLLLSMARVGFFGGPRGTNILDGGAPFYGVYACKDGGWMSVGCLEPQFFQTFLEIFMKSLPKSFYVQLDGWVPTTEIQHNREEWPKLKHFLEQGFLSETRQYWTARFHGTDACTVPVLTLYEAGKLDASGSLIPQPHPRVASLEQKPSLNGDILTPGKHSSDILREMGVSDSMWQQLLLDGAIEEPIIKHKL
ncbi:CoA-transferase family III [Guyanagaster necrorhizus]|uniref:CoA-transferase family III n=1 Tax=Guyanagaster necrorhizus TaxID=856835 RepID=A0A9P7W2B3_9AGAR|nr:CoA-transferase family III [Guyanagaster necrorhizus MCA 3950]KAG7451105.1 CoA-transferase family III [Guyanagaster necrorhizus MCA 3950]